MQASCPPKPRELDSTRSACTARGLVGHIVQVTGGVGLLQVDGGGQDALLQGLQAGHRLNGAGGPRQWPVMDLVELM